MEKELVKRDIERMVTSSMQVLDELPEEEIEALGGEGALIARTKVNIADSLSWDGLNDWSDKIKNMNIDRAKKMEDFVNELTRMLNSSFT